MKFRFCLSIKKWSLTGPRLVGMSAIRAYQKTLSPDQGFFRSLFPHGFCPYYPHCSEYCYQAIQKYGIVSGTWLGVKRILRCHPWCRGGHDPVV